MNKKNITIISLLIVMTLLVGCVNNKEENKKGEDANQNIIVSSGDNNIKDEPSGNTEKTRYSKDINLQEVERSIIEVANIQKSNVIKNEDVSELYELEDFEGLESVVIIEEDGTNYQEIAVIKLLEESQSDKMIAKIITRYNYLLNNKKEYSSIISNKENVRMKQQAGVGILIVSENMPEIEKAIDNYFN